MPTGWRVGFGPVAGPARMHEPGTADRGRRPLIGPSYDLNQHHQTNRRHKSTIQPHYEQNHIKVGINYHNNVDFALVVGRIGSHSAARVWASIFVGKTRSGQKTGAPRNRDSGQT